MTPLSKRDRSGSDPFFREGAAPADLIDDLPGSQKTKRRLWLDGGYDREEVEQCVYHPAHKWIVLRLGDVRPHPHDPDELHVICRGCFVPRCGHTTDSDPCMLPRHHPERHLTASGAEESADEWPGCDKPDPPDILTAYGDPH